MVVSSHTRSSTGCITTTEGRRETVFFSDGESSQYGEGKRSILFVEQYLDFTRSICDRFYVIEKGVVAPESDPEVFRMAEVSAYLSV